MDTTGDSALLDLTESGVNLVAAPGSRPAGFGAGDVVFSCNQGVYSANMLQELHSFRDVFYTYIHEGRHESLDHILASEQFYDYSKRRQWSLSRLEVFNDHLDERMSHTNLIPP